MLRRLGALCLHRLGAQQSSCQPCLPGAAAAAGWPAELQTLSALAAAASGGAQQLQTSAPLQQEFISLNNISDNPGATKTVRLQSTAGQARRSSLRNFSSVCRPIMCYTLCLEWMHAQVRKAVTNHDATDLAGEASRPRHRLQQGKDSGQGAQGSEGPLRWVLDCSVASRSKLVTDACASAIGHGPCPAHEICVWHLRIWQAPLHPGVAAPSQFWEPA